MMFALLMVNLLAACASIPTVPLKPKIDKVITMPCKPFKFKAGDLVEQAVQLLTEYEVCKAKHKATIELLEPG